MFSVPYIYPSIAGKVTCADGKERELGEDRYLNRLQEFLARRLPGSTSKHLLQAELDYLSKFLSRLNEMPSKGVHASVTLAEAKQGLVQRDWWRAFPSGLQVLHWRQRIAGAMGLWPLSDRSAARLINAQIKESALTGRMMRPFRHTPAGHWYVSGIVLRPELAGTCAIRVLLAGGLRRWLDTAAIAFPFQFLALASSKEGELVLTRFGFHSCQKAHAMPDNIALFVLDAENRDDLLSVLEPRLGPLH